MQLDHHMHLHHVQHLVRGCLQQHLPIVIHIHDHSCLQLLLLSLLGAEKVEHLVSIQGEHGGPEDEHLGRGSEGLQVFDDLGGLLQEGEGVGRGRAEEEEGAVAAFEEAFEVRAEMGDEL